MERLVARRIIADKYRLDRPLAAGGMGSVWAAWNTHLDVPVAVKFMAPPLAASQELVARFEREARAAAQLRSPHVVQIFEHGIDGGLPFIVMELLEGEDLGTRMRRAGRLSLVQTADVVAGVCKALRRAHAMGIVHRDLKPANVYLAHIGDEDDDEVVKVLDFGVVKSLGEHVDSGVTKTGELIGTPSYMSPEQARTTKKVDHRSDLWSLGIIAYRALTASLPFPKEEGLDRLMRICQEPIPPPSSIHPDIGPDVDAFFERALAIEPDARYQTAREMAEAMKALAGVPASSRSDSRASIGDGGPPSSSVYTAHAYVYTSASDAEGVEKPGGRSPISPGAGGRRVPFASDIPSGTGSAGRAEPSTRVSHVHPEAPRPARPSERPPVSIVTGALADGSGPLPPLRARDLDTLSSVGLSQTPPNGGRWIAPPRAVLGAGLALLLGLGLVVFVLSSRRLAADPGAPSTSAKAAQILFATVTLPAEAPTATATAQPDGPAAEAAMALASAAPEESSSPQPAALPSSQPVVKGARWRPAAPGSRGRPAPPPRKEGGIGRRPTY